MDVTVPIPTDDQLRHVQEEAAKWKARAEKLASALRSVGAMPNEVTLLDGTAPAVGQRVVIDFEACRSVGLAHAHDGFVHEITRFDPSFVLIECGPTQINPGHLRLVPEGSEVTCRSCLGWRDYMVRLRMDAEAYRAMQVNAVFEAARKLLRPKQYDDFDREWAGLHEEATKKAGLSASGSRDTALASPEPTAAPMLAAIRAALARQDSPLPFREVVEGILAGKVET